MRQSKFKTVLFCVAIFLTTLMSMQDSAILPIADALYHAFPGKDFVVNFAITGPSIIFFFSSLIAPAFLKVMSKKNTLLVTCIVFTVSCIAGTFYMSLPLLLIIRVIAGFCCGIQMVVSIDLITEYFENQTVRTTVIGLYNAAQAGVGAIVGIIAGNFAVKGWEHVFDLYWINILMTILVILFVPSKSGEYSEEKEEEKNASGKLPAAFWKSVINFALFCIVYGPLYFMAALYIAENNLGNEAYAGLATSFGTIGSALICLAFGIIYKKFKFKSSLMSYIILVAGLFVCAFVPDKTVFLIISVFGGFGYGAMITYQFSNISNIVEHTNVTKAISYVNAFNAVGLFFCSYVLTAMINIVGSVTKCMFVYGFVAVVLLIFEIFTTKTMKQI